jgi:carbon monoxide dehydrogenase subunit G
MIQFEGDRDIDLPPSSVWAKLSDASFLVMCIPDLESVKQAESSAATCVIRPGFAFVRGTLELSILVTEAVPDQSVGLHLRTKGIGNTSTVEALLTLAAQSAGTHVHWRAQVTEMGGLLKMVPEGLVRGAAQKAIADVWTAVEARLRD